MRRAEQQRWPAGETPVERMERLALRLNEMADDVKRVAIELKEEASAERSRLEQEQRPTGS